MTDTLGEDRLLDLGDIERALQAATPGPWRALSHPAPESGVIVHWVERSQDGKTRVWYFDTADEATAVADVLNNPALANAPAWLARLCARVRHLEAERDELLKARSIWDTSITAAWKAEQETRAASQRLTEALRMIAEYNVGANHGAVDEWTEAAAFHDCKKLAQATLGAGAPPEVEK